MRTPVALAAPDEDRRPAAVEAVLAMISTASIETRRQVHRLLTADLRTVESAAQRRVADLGFLASLLPEPDSGLDFGVCRRAFYDELRPSSAPSSRQLVEAYRSWSRACRAAASLGPDGAKVGAHRPWRGNVADHLELYTKDEVLTAVRQCAAELQRSGLFSSPTSWQYDEWVRRKKLAAYGHGRVLRLPYASNIYRHFPRPELGRSRWNAVLEAAGLTAGSGGAGRLEA